MLALYAKAVRFKPSCSHMPLQLPRIHRYRRVTINAKHCNNYNRLTNWHCSLAALVHPNYMQTLSLPMQLDMMVDSSFPFKPLGLVHMANQIQVNCLPEQNQSVDVYTYFGDVYFHRKGWLFEVLTQVHATDFVVKKNDIGESAPQAMLIGKSYYLARAKHEPQDIQSLAQQYSSGPNWIAAQKIDLANAGLAQQNNVYNTKMRFDENIGRRYARISGDYNPIHLHPLTAKLLGFKKAIAHGMYSKALVLSNIAKVVPFYQQGFTINTVFIQPILLPLDTELSFSGSSNTSNMGCLGQLKACPTSKISYKQHEFALESQARRKKRSHLSGSICY